MPSSPTHRRGQSPAPLPLLGCFQRRSGGLSGLLLAALVDQGLSGRLWREDDHVPMLAWLLNGPSTPARCREGMSTRLARSLRQPGRSARLIPDVGVRSVVHVRLRSATGSFASGRPGMPGPDREPIGQVAVIGTRLRSAWISATFGEFRLSKPRRYPCAWSPAATSVRRGLLRVLWLVRCC